MQYTAECTWGDGPDVLLTINGYTFDLNMNEARELSAELLIAATHAQNLELLARSHDESVRTTPH